MVINGINIGKLNVFIKNNRAIDLNDITCDITVRNIGLLKRIDSKTVDTIKLLEPEEQKKLKTELIRGFGRVEIIVKATISELTPVTTTASGFVLGRIIIVLPSE